MNGKSRATIEFPKDLWRDFMVYVKKRSTTASHLIRSYVRATLEKEGKQNAS